MRKMIPMTLESHTQQKKMMKCCCRGNDSVPKMSSKLATLSPKLVLKFACLDVKNRMIPLISFIQLHNICI